MKTRCIPPQADADFVFHMEDVLATYQLPYDPGIPVICMDEASKQLIGEVATPLPMPPVNRSAWITNTSGWESVASSSSVNHWRVGVT